MYYLSFSANAVPSFSYAGEHNGTLPPGTWVVACTNNLTTNVEIALNVQPFHGPGKGCITTLSWSSFK